MQPTIKTLPPTKLIGMRLTMSFANFRIAELWQNFGPKRKEILNNVNDNLISMVIYSPDHFKHFKPTNQFERWAAVEVIHYDYVPAGMEPFDLKGGLYAVFDYKGLSTDNSIFQYIYGTWLPNSGYQLDNRPHFEVLGEKYKNNDPESEEEIWIPVRQ